MNPRGPIEWLDACAAGIYLLFAVIQLDLWLRRRERVSHLWLAAAGGGALLVDVTGIVLRRGTPDAGGLLPTLNLLGVLVVTASVFELVCSLSGARPNHVTRAMYALLAGLAIVIGSGTQHRLLPVFLIACGVLLLMAMVHVIRDARAGEPESRLVAAGLILLVATLLLDILGMTRVLPFVPGLPIVGFTTLFVLAARALSGRYEREYRELLVLRNELEHRVQDRTRALEEANQRLAEVSMTDSLTGLLNRRAFLEAAERELQTAQRTHRECSVIMVDLDHFKEINDRQGHAAGDVMLKAAAISLRSVLREQDLIARWGGEEFILLLPDTDGKAALAVAGNARTVLAATADAGATSARITASFGIATHRNERTLDSTIAAADQALYRAKEAGRNCVVAE